MPDGCVVQEQTVNLPLLRMQAQLMQETFNAKDRTVEVVFYSGTRMPRYDLWNDKEYDLEFVMDEGACDLSRLNNGAPVCNSHSTYALSDVIGVVVKAWRQNGEYRALLRFSGRADVQPYWQDVQDGIIRNISMGTDLNEVTIIIQENGRELWKVTKWQPYEISFVAVQADPNASTRLAAAEDKSKPNLFPCRLQRLQVAPPPTPAKELTMAEENNTAANEATPPATNPASSEPAPAVAPAVSTPAASSEPASEVVAEQLRCLEITRSCKAMKLSDEVREKLITENIPLADARTRILQLAVQQSEANGINITASATHSAGNSKQDLSHLSLEDAAKVEWDGSRELQAEFGKFSTYLAFKKADNAGTARIFSKKTA